MTKLSISIFLFLCILAFFYKKEFSKAKSDAESTFNTIGENKFSLQDQQKYLNYIFSAKYYKFEETDYRYIEAGSVITDSTEFGKGEKVVHCSSGRDKPGYIVRGAIIPGVSEKVKNKWINDTLHSFYIKPRIRIRKELIYPVVENYNDQNFHTQVCKLEIVNTEGKVIKELEYEAEDFFEKHPDDDCRIYYSGNYHEGSGGYLSFDSLIIIDGKEINPKGKHSIGKSKLDYRVYWYGYTDMWLDYVEVKNDAARELLNGRYDILLNAMEGVNAEDIGEIKPKSFPPECYHYILEKLNKKEFSLR